MKAIVGLGNPGPRYRHTRHNAGWQVLDELARRWGRGLAQKARHADVLRFLRDGENIALVKPLTFMNDSGRAVRALVEKDHLTPGDVLVVYDDIDLAQGRLRLRAGGSSGGHNGIKSIQEHLHGAEFPRIKLGLGRPPAGMDPMDYVLTTFKPDELTVVKPAIERAADAVECWLADGFEVAMNRFNAPPSAPRPEPALPAAQ